MTKPAPVKRPKKIADPIALPLADRTKLIALLNDPVMQRALANVGTLKFSACYGGSGTGVNAAKDAQMALLMANNRLHQIQGWEAFEAALFCQAEDPKVRKAPVTETYNPET